MWLLLLLVAIGLYVTVTLLNRIGKPPGPFGLPVLGYLPFIDPVKPYETFTRLGHQYGPIYGLWMGQVYAVVLTDPALIRTTLAKDEVAGRAPLFVTHGIMGGNGIICAEGEMWRDQRRLSIDWLRKMGMTKFGAARATLEQRILTGVNELIQDIKTESEKVFAFDPVGLLQHAQGNLMNDVVLGLRYAKDDETWTYLKHLQEEGVKHIGVSMAANFLPFLRHLPATKRVIEFLLNGKAKTHKIYDVIIGERRNVLGTVERTSILTSFLQEAENRIANGQMDEWFTNDIQLRHLIADLFGAGLDTTNSVTRWALLYIAFNKDVQRTLREEMKAQLSSAPTLDDVDSLPYLRACIAETLRIRTVVPVGIPHGTTTDVEIGGYRIPKNSMVMPMLWAIHMDPARFPEPETFNPNRFLNDDRQFSTPSCFLPFQCGRRMCPGDELARMVLSLYISHIFYHYELQIFSPDTLDLTGTCGITLAPPKCDIIFQRKPIHSK